MMESPELVYESGQLAQMVFISTVPLINSTNKSSIIHIVLSNSISQSHQVPVTLMSCYHVSLTIFTHLKQKYFLGINSRDGVPQQPPTWSI